MVEVHGYCDERFTPIREHFRAEVESGRDEGAAYAIEINGELAVDLWGGYRDLARTKPWAVDTLVPVASTSKVVTAIATLMLWDRGLIDIDKPIATYWPEFAQNGKGAITPRQVLVHRSGVPGFGRAITLDEVLDWDRLITILEQAPVWYEPGTMTAYQHQTFGYILGELLQRVCGCSFAKFVADEITAPLGADFHFAPASPADEARRAEVWVPPDVGHAPAAGTAMAERAIAEFADIVEALFLDPEFPWVVNPGGSGITTARALVRIGSIMSRCGEVDGRRYLSRATVAEAVREQSYARDEVMAASLRRGLFFALDARSFPAPTPTTIHWGGFGGSWVTMDPASGITCACVPNRYLVGDEWLLRQAKQWQVLIDVLPNTR
jgi:CubicO group peptidase (beta-lactamase class C family)